MKIQFNTDNNLDGDERNEQYFSTEIEKGLKRFQSYITRVEVHLSDENGKKEVGDDKSCLLEVRLEGKQPVVVTAKANSVSKAVAGAVDKMSAALDTIVGKMHNKH